MARGPRFPGVTFQGAPDCCAVREVAVPGQERHVQGPSHLDCGGYRAQPFRIYNYATIAGAQAGPRGPGRRGEWLRRAVRQP